jgi:amino acid adenylation domain-containing protein
MTMNKQNLAGTEAAVIGMAGRFPAAGNCREFWENLKNGVEAIAFFSDEELKEGGTAPEVLKDPNYVKARGVLERDAYFDALFFGYTPREAAAMDPQIRLFHEVTWEALEDAGYDPRSYEGLIGLYAGASSHFFWEAKASLSGGDWGGFLLSDKDYLGSRVSYKLDLKGPCSVVHTACSTSLVAIHQAYRALLTGECGMALAGGVSVQIPQKHGYLYQEGMISSADGHCRAFDAKASGVIDGSGAAVVVLKRLKKAIKAGDHIYAVLKGTAVNNDGERKIGFTAPSIEGQAEVIRTAQRLAGVEPESITYVETHGTATGLGDRVEIEALKLAFNTGEKGFCRIGSVKTNVGHMDAAAGVTGFIKTVLAVKYGFIPASLHFEAPNPEIDFADSPFYVAAKSTPWQSDGHPLRAGVSSFGIGGTNVHVILEEYRPVMRTYIESEQLILLSARTRSALDSMSQNLAEHVKSQPDINLADAAYTLQVGRRKFQHRRMLVCRSVEEAACALSNPAAENERSVLTFAAAEEHREPPLIFMFPGLGSEYVNMGRELYEKEPLFRREMDRCFEILGGLLNYDIKEILYPGNSGRDPEEINRAEIAQLVVFIFEYALAKLLIHWGIAPRAMIGYSFGEYAAACVSGVFSLEDALKLVVGRGELIAGTSPGAMLSVPLPKGELIPLLPPQLSLAVDNDISCLVAGPEEAVETFEKQMKVRKSICLRLRAAKAIHSPTMTPILREFEEKVREIKLNSPVIPYISNVTGTWISPAEAADPHYWPTHLRQIVRFADGLKRLVKDEENPLFIEVGPGHDLSSLVLRYIQKDNPKQWVINLVRGPQSEWSDVYFLLDRIGRLWLYGKTPDWSAFYAGEERRRVALPTYPFEENPYTVEGDPLAVVKRRSAQRSLLDKEADPADWFYLPSWKRLQRPKPGDVEAAGGGTAKQWWLIFGPAEGEVPGLVTGLVRRLEQDEGNGVVTAAPGSEFVRVNERSYIVCPQNRRHYQQLFAELQRSGIAPRKILHCWNISRKPDETDGLDAAAVERDLELGFYSLLYLVQAIGRQKQALIEGREITVIANNMQDVVGEAYLCPAKATLLGPVNVISQEYPNICCRSIDVVIPPERSREETQLVDQVLAEVQGEISDTVVAFRGNLRWVRSYEPFRLEEGEPEPRRLKQGGVYIISGGLGDIGLILAEHLFRSVDARLVLFGRTALPPRSRWEEWLKTHDQQDKIGNGIRKIRELENRGAEILVLSADVTDEEKMREVVARAEERFGQINGVIHAAGVTNTSTFRLVADITTEQCRQQLAPKMYGLLVLAKVLVGKNLDFCLLMSSISSVLGGLGFAAYSAANLFMDAFVSYHNRLPGQPWISVNWDGWQLAEPNSQAGTIGASLARLAMTPAEGFEVFRRVLSWQDARQVVISTGSLQARIDQWVKLESVKAAAGEENRQEQDALTQPRPDLMSSYKAPRNPLEETIAGILQRMLGYEKIGIEDDFFELGVDSIKIIQVRARLNKRGYAVELADFFQYPTIAKLAAVVKKVESTEEPEPLSTADAGPAPAQLTYQGLSVETLERLNKQYPIEDIYPLTPMQEGMFFHSLYNRENTPMYFDQLSYRLQGHLDISLMEKSLNGLLERHDILRSAFIHQGLDRPLQVVLRERRVEFYYEDIRHMAQNSGGNNGDDREAFIGAFKGRDRRRSFDLANDTLMRVAVIQVGDREYELIWSYPHVLLDGWCLGILTSECFEIYHSCLQDRPCRLTPAKPYRTFIQWLDRRDKEEMKRYWKEYLAGYEAPVGIRRKKYLATWWAFEDEYRPAAVTTVLEEHKVLRLQQTANWNRVTLNTLFQALWGVVLGKYSGKPVGDVVFGSVVSGRPPQIQGVETMVGCFINTVPVRVRFDEKTGFSDLIREVQQKAIESEPYHYYPLAEIQAESPLKQDLLDHIFEYQNFPLEKQMEDVEEEIRTGEDSRRDVEPIKISNINAFEQGNYDFNVMVVPRGQIFLFINYNADVYERQIVERVGFHSLHVLDQIIENDEIAIGEITLLSEAEKRQILHEFNNNAADFSAAKTVHRWIEESAAAVPHRIAFVGASPGTGTGFMHYMSYKELNRRANQLARALQAAGMQPGSLVGILLERSPLMAVSILAVWKGGGAYIPLDSQYPLPRLTGILEDSGAAVLIGQAECMKPGLPEVYPGTIVNVSPDVSNGICENLDCDIDMGGLSYVIYTSGSTGRPKGAMVEHIGMMNHMQAKINDLRLNERSIVAQNACHTFDISVWQFFTALILGGQTVIYPDELVFEPDLFLSRLERDRVTVLEVVPSYLAILLDTLRAQPGRGKAVSLTLQYLLVTGEEVKAALVREWFAEFPGIKMVNAYGPTEASDDITHHVMDKTPDGDRIPIGKPLPNLNIYIVDDRMQLCPVGIRGEIWVSGLGVGRGYLNDEEKSIEVFGADPFAEARGDRLYKTGDLGSWLPDGTIEFFGRKDYQVKIRGFRIELAEIENQLAAHPAIKEAVVVDKEDEAGNKYLCAYVKAASAASISSAGLVELKEYLSTSLPDYMIPAYFVTLEKIPLTANGKVDRQALPSVEVKTAGRYVGPRTAIEKELAKLWSEVLNVPEHTIGLTANFFQLGGHSLKAMTLMAGIHRELEVKIPLAEIFRNQTVGELARYITGVGKERFVAVEPAEEKEYYDVSSAQKRLYLFQQLEPDSVVYNIPSTVVLTMALGPEKLGRTAEQLIDRHGSLRTAFVLVGGKPVQRVQEAGETDFEVEYDESPPSLEAIVTGFVRPFDLAEAPLLRVGLVKLAGEKYLLMADMHHIITDALSMNLFIEEAVALYRGEELSPLKLQYKDFSEWQNALHRWGNPILEKQRHYWREQFRGELPRLNLPQDFPRPPLPRFEGGRVTCILGKEETAACRELAAAAGATLYIVLLALVNLLLSKLSGQEDIVLGVTTVGRWSEDLRQIIGMFINTLALRNYPSADRTFPEFLAEVKERTLAAFDNQDYPFEELAAELLPRRDRSRNPLFDVMLVFNNLDAAAAPAAPETSPADISQTHAINHRITKFDLSIIGTETAHYLSFIFEYSTALFKKETIRQFVDYFREIVAAVTGDENRELRLKDIAISHTLLEAKLDVSHQEFENFEL